MKPGTFMGSLYQLCVWVMRLAYLNILWVLFSIAGLLIFGIGPSTAAMFAVTRKWVMGEKDIPIFATFWEASRTEFIKSNVLLGIFIIIGFVLYFDLRFLLNYDGWLFTILTVGLISLIVLYLFVFLFVYPVFVHYNFNTFQYVKYSLLIVICNPLKLVLLTISMGLAFIGFLIMPGLILFFSGSLVSLLTMYFASTIFVKIDGNNGIKGDKDMETKHLTYSS
ncbi:hypothetical protein CR203_14015 [Salipaludibacillus neizhouensis]|uniref:DUF624 domain-containing protein n=1 Tax=Salipaludibacillus neizhouensis TaxID=885475 RepID=A0A3A9K2J5_9BACI|nr:YesL family protein [Salipaludibacillus neizhouensis]RKL66937.1 hypothetical protein CR203_14015 [Salipaludibacillus neizhouensis]